VDGKCLPIPKCSQNIIHASALVKNFDDDGNVCNAGQPFAPFYLLGKPQNFQVP